VLLQGYPNLEYIVIDGGSVDSTMKTIRKYDTWISFLESEPDLGQAHALNKGFSRASGSLVGWLNGDDILLPNALWRLAMLHVENPESILLGNVVNIDMERGIKWEVAQRNVCFSKLREHWRYPVTWHQPGTFMPISVYSSIGDCNIRLSYVFDWDYMCRALQCTPVIYLRFPVARFRYHKNSKSMNYRDQWIQERQYVTRRYWPDRVAKSPQLSKAVMHLVSADVSLVLHSQFKTQGIMELWKAAASDIQVMRWRRYWLLWLKALLPLPVLEIIRWRRKSF
jgi:glycosyltransferase involved in cell wall biosynthesis